MIGREDSDGEESFGIQICTPEWLKSEYSESDVVFGHHFLIVFEYDLQRIKQEIAKYCEDCVGNDWMEIVSKLRLIGNWEFEDYQQNS